jgi:hypothetical protein
LGSLKPLFPQLEELIIFDCSMDDFPAGVIERPTLANVINAVRKRLGARNDGIALIGAKDVTPPAAPAPTKMPPLSRAGVDLANLLLFMIAVFVVIAVIWIWMAESNYSAWLVHTHVRGDPSLESMASAEGSFREFWLNIFQIVLLNVLLPVLTAILGYTFGSSQSGKT